jgi:hypothetical protein
MLAIAVISVVVLILTLVFDRSDSGMEAQDVFRALRMARTKMEDVNSADSVDADTIEDLIIVVDNLTKVVSSLCRDYYREDEE